MTSAERSYERALQLAMTEHQYSATPAQRRALLWRILLRAARTSVRASGARTPDQLHCLPGVEQCKQTQPSRT